MTYNEFLEKINQGKTSAFKPDITYVRSDKTQTQGQTGGQVSGQKVEQPIDPTNPYAAPMEEWRASWQGWNATSGTPYMPAEYSGPNGEQTPYGAKGWDYNGNPWYGDGMLGFFNELKSKLTAPITGVFGEENPIVFKDAASTPVGVPGGMGALSEEQKANLKEKTEDTQAVDWKETVSNLEAGEGGGAVTAIPTRLVSNAVDLVLAIYNEPAKKTKQLFSVTQGMTEGAEESPLPSSQEVIDEVNLPDWLDDTIKYNPTFVHLKQDYDTLRYALAPGSFKEKWNELESSYQAGRVFYTQFADASVRDEYKRRLASGENPYLLAQELENPLAELAGELVFDPMNLVGGAGIKAGKLTIGRGARDAKNIEDAIEMFAKISPELEDFIKSADALDDIKAASGFTDIVNSVVKHADDVTKGMTKLATKRGLGTLTAKGAQWEVSRMASEVLGNIGAATKDNPDEAMEIVRALMNFASGDADKTADGLATIIGASRTVKNMQPEVLLSEGALRTGALLNNMVGDEKKAAKFLDTLGEARKLDDAKFIEWLGKKIDGATKDMFPTVTERMKIASDIASGKIADPTEYQKMVSEVAPAMQIIATVDKNAQKFVWGPINTAASYVYFSPPAFAVRNILQNFGQMFIDYGAGVYKGASHAVEDISGWLGGVIPQGVEGFSPASLTQKKLFAGSKWSAQGEKYSATLVVRHSVEQTMRKMLVPGRAIPDTKPLIEAGMSDKAATQLWHMVINNKGNVAKAVDEFMEVSKTGAINAVETLSWMAKNDAKKLQDLKIYDGVQSVLKQAKDAGKTVDEAMADVKKLFDDNIFSVADDVVNDPQVISKDLPELKTLSKAAKEMGEREAQEVGNLYQANRECFYTGRTAIDDIFRGAEKQASQTGDAELITNLQTLQQKYESIATGEREAQYMDEISKWADDKADWRTTFDAAVKDKTFRTPEYFARKWKELKMTSDAPVELGEFYDRYWNEFYYPTKNGMWAQYRGELVGALNEVGKSAGGNTAKINSALETAKSADSYQQSFEVWRKGRLATATALRSGDIPNALRAMASQYGISTAPKADKAAGATGALLKDDTLLNIINKNSGKKYKSLLEVDPEIARKAFAKHFNKNAGKTETIGKNVEQMAKMAEKRTPEISAALEHPMRQTVIDAVNKPLKDRIDIYASVPRDELSPQLSEYILNKATEFQGKKEFNADALNKIIEGKGADTGSDVFGIKRAIMNGLPEEELNKLTKIAEEVGEEITTAAKTIPVYSGDMPPTMARGLHEGRQSITELLGRVEQQIRNIYDEVIPVIGDEKTTAAVKAWATEATSRVNKARLIAANVANAARDFTLLPYGKKYGFDLVANYVMPYQFWYSRTYANYLKRLTQSPDVIAAYAKYKEFMAKEHAGAPDWWKYNVNSNELLGLDSDNPLYFNLEATLNPLYGIAGVDFNDANKRVNWWTSMVDDMGKFGPSLWAPINWGIAAALYSQGEKDAAERWGGRMIPHTATIKSLLYLGNIKTGIRYNELDPIVQFLSGGIDPYERRRVGKALGAMVQEGIITPTQMDEAGYSQSGEIWDEAVARAVKDRAPGQISSFFLGVGFKGRSVSDLTIDKFYNEYYQLWDESGTLSSDEIRIMMDELRDKYPFMDGLLLSRKSGLDRDRGYGYNVLARIPPGQKSDIAKAAGISSELMTKFYDDKGDMSQWSKTDYDKFMAAIVDIGAVLEMPDSATRQEWGQASSDYKSMMSQGQEIFGADIWDRLEAYNALNYSDDYVEQQKAELVLSLDPELQQAIDWKNQSIMENTLLSSYYGGIGVVEKFYKSIMYNDMRQRFGKDIYDLQNEYYDIYDSKERKQFLKDHPQLKNMWDAKSKWDKRISNYIANTGKMLQEGSPAVLREDVEPSTTGQEAVVNALQSEQSYSWDDYQKILGNNLSNLVMDSIVGGEELSYAAENQLEYIADRMGISVERLLAMLEQSLQ